MSTNDEFTPLPDTHVYELIGNEQITRFLETHSRVLAPAFVPPAPNWRRFKPVFENLAEILARAGSEVKCARLDGSKPENLELIRKVQIPRIPTLILFEGPEKCTKYRGILREQEILEFLKRQELPVVSKVDSTSLLSLRGEHSVVIVAALGPDHSQELAEFGEIAAEFRDDYVFATTSDTRIDGETVQTPNIVVLKTAIEQRTVLDNWPDAASLRAFIQTAGEPLVPEIRPELWKRYVAGPVPTLGYIFVSSASDEPNARESILPVARKHASKIRFGTVVGPIFELLVEEMNLPEDQKWPCFVLHSTAENLKYPLIPSEPWGDGIGIHEIAAFVDKFLAGELEPSLKSAPAPVQDGPLIQVVGSTFRPIVLDNDRDVLVDYYSEDCGGCHVLLPHLQRLAEANAADERGSKLVTIAMMNLDDNDSLDSDLRGFPTVKLYPAGKKNKPVFFPSGNIQHRAENWAEFIKKEGTHGVELKL
ncbi:hypothetical protein OQA88_8112 [Cercophora sp. LCS_1]